MGIKGLRKLLAANAPMSAKVQKLESYSGHAIAIDASISICQFLAVVGRRGTVMLTNEAGGVTSHLQGMFTRTIGLLEAGLLPVYVFDGKPSDLKKHTLAKRHLERMDAAEALMAAIEMGNKENIEKLSKRTLKVTRQHSEDCKKLLRLMGMPVVEAYSEAEAECATLCMSGKVYAVASEDMDSLAFGAPRLLRQLKLPRSRRGQVIEFEVAKILENLNLTMDQFIDLCILCGCDYCDSIKGIGGQTALKLIRLHNSIENILENLSKERYHIPMNWPYREARHVFKEPLALASDQLPKILWTTIDEEGLITFLVNDNGFNHDRVARAIKKLKAAKNRSFVDQVEAFVKPMACTSPVGQKGAKCVIGTPSKSLKLKVFSQLCSRPKIFGYVCLPALDLGSNHLGPFFKGVCFSV